MTAKYRQVSDVWGLTWPCCELNKGSARAGYLVRLGKSVGKGALPQNRVCVSVSHLMLYVCSLCHFGKLADVLMPEACLEYIGCWNTQGFTVFLILGSQCSLGDNGTMKEESNCSSGDCILLVALGEGSALYKNQMGLLAVFIVFCTRVLACSPLLGDPSSSLQVLRGQKWRKNKELWWGEEIISILGS